MIGRTTIFSMAIAVMLITIPSIYVHAATQQTQYSQQQDKLICTTTGKALPEYYIGHMGQKERIAGNMAERYASQCPLTGGDLQIYQPSKN